MIDLNIPGNHGSYGIWYNLQLNAASKAHKSFFEASSESAEFLLEKQHLKKLNYPEGPSQSLKR